MEALKEFLGGSTFRRFVVFAVGAVAVLLNKKLGLELGMEEQAALVTLVIAYLGQSAYKEAAKAKAMVSAADIKSVEDAIAEFKKGLGPQP